MAATPILCVTRADQGAPGVTIATIYGALFCQRRTPLYIQNGGLGYAHSRNVLFREARQQLGVKVARGFLLDDDIRIIDQKALEKVLARADANQWNIVAPYRALNGRLSILKTIPPQSNGTSTEMLTEDELHEIHPWDRIQLAGLGFYYGDIPLDYIFHEGNPYVGEDLNFFHENKYLETRLAPLYVEHIKQTVLPGVKYSG